MSMLESILAVGGSITEIQVSRTNRETNERLAKISLDGLLSPHDLADSTAVCQAIAASKGAQLTIGDVSGKIDGLSASVAYSRDSGANVDESDLADIAIGGVLRDAMTQHARQSTEDLRNRRARLERETREAREAPATVEAVEA